MPLSGLSFVGSVSAVAFSPDEALLYAGVGPYLRVYRVSDGALLEVRLAVPSGSRVHGLICRRRWRRRRAGATGSGAAGGEEGGASWDVAVYGQKSVALLACNCATSGELKECLGTDAAATSTSAIPCAPQHFAAVGFPQMKDWVLNLGFPGGMCEAAGEGGFREGGDALTGELLVGMAHNSVELWRYIDWHGSSHHHDHPPPLSASAAATATKAWCVGSVLCETRCLLYSLAFLPSSGREGGGGALVASGTPFGHVVLWRLPPTDAFGQRPEGQPAAGVLGGGGCGGGGGGGEVERRRELSGKARELG
jgi:hypothetical protein